MYKMRILIPLTSWSCKGHVKLNMRKSYFQTNSPSQLFCSIFLHFSLEFWSGVGSGYVPAIPGSCLLHKASLAPVCPVLSLLLMPMALPVCFILWTVYFNLGPMIHTKYLILNLHRRKAPCWGDACVAFGCVATF